MRQRRARRSRRELFVAAIGLGSLGALLGACGSTAAPPNGTTTSTTALPTTTTTTTLPAPVVVPGTRAGGSFSSFGPVERVPVIADVIGATATTPRSPSATGPDPASVEIAYRQFGSGPDLLLVAGEHSSMSWWDPQLLSDLAQHYTVTLFDLPGTGYSGPDASATSVEAVADLTAGFVTALDLSSPVVLGWGLGGEVALALAERHAGLVSKLALVDSSPGGPAAVKPASSVAALLASPTANQIELSALLFPAAATAARTGWIARIAELPPDDLVASSVREEASLQAAAWTDSSIVAGLGAIRDRALVVFGSADAVFPPAGDALLLAHLRHAHELVLPGAGYASTSEDEPQFVAALETFTG